MKQLKVDAIKDGTVIDHIAAGKAMMVLKILKTKGSYPISIGMNLLSSKMGAKDIVKIENHFITTEEFNRIALIAPDATIIIIKDYEVKEKHKITIPKNITDVVFCPNPNCITNVEKIASKFSIYDDKIKNTSFICDYCEKIYNTDSLKIKL